MRPRIGITSASVVDDQRAYDRINGWYASAVSRAGGIPFILPILNPDDAADVLAGLDGLVLSGGGDVSPGLYGEAAVPEVYDVDHARDAWEMALIHVALGGGPGTRTPGAPVLGICRGAQLLNVSAGGSLIQHLPNVTAEPHRERARDQEEVHAVELEATSRLAAILGHRRVMVNSIHHQAVDRVGEGYRAVGWAPDGIIEAIEASDGSPVVAIQWHPEALADRRPHRQLFGWLTQTAAERRPSIERRASGHPVAERSASEDTDEDRPARDRPGPKQPGPFVPPEQDQVTSLVGEVA